MKGRLFANHWHEKLGALFGGEQVARGLRSCLGNLGHVGRFKFLMGDVPFLEHGLEVYGF